MAILDRLLEVAADQRGMVSAGDAGDVGVNPVELRKLAARGRLERIGHGVYRFPTFPRRAGDELMEAVLWTGKRGVIGGASALELHDLCDVNPRRVELTVPPGYRPRKQGAERYRVRHAALGAGEIEQVDGIPVVIPERAIRDGIATGVDPRLIDQAITTARRRGEIGVGTEEELREALAHARRAGGRPEPGSVAG